jgi:hypothetical protein
MKRTDELKTGYRIQERPRKSSLVDGETQDEPGWQYIWAAGWASFSLLKRNLVNTYVTCNGTYLSGKLGNEHGTIQPEPDS